MSPHVRIGAWLIVQLALLAGWAFAISHGYLWTSMVPLAVFISRRMPSW